MNDNKVKIYDIKSSASVNFPKLRSPEGKYFYWNNAQFKGNEIGDKIFFIDRRNKWALCTELKVPGIESAYNSSTDISSFNHEYNTYRVSGKYDVFIRFDIIGEARIPAQWNYSKQLGQSEVYDLFKPGKALTNPEDRIRKIDDLKKIFDKGVPFQLLEEVRRALSLQAELDPGILAADNPSIQRQTNEKNLTELNEDSTPFVKIDENSDGFTPMSPKEIIEHVHKYLENKGFHYLFEEIANFYLCIKVKPFVILAGISGTGKSQLPRRFAEAIGMDPTQVSLVPVRPDWTDGSELIGYTALDNKFRPQSITLAIKNAISRPKEPFFFVLDEMNLARVEHYFSDFLSIIETRIWADDRKEFVVTDQLLRKEVLENAENKSEFSGLYWPDNLYLIGTVNMDETTHGFSRKVLDRANSIEMNDVDLNWLNIEGVGPSALTGISNAFLRTEYLTATDLNVEDRLALDADMTLLKKVNGILQVADMQFAYRVRDEVAFYLLLNKKLQLMPATTAFDFQMVQKVLPRIHGSSDRTQRVLVELLNLFEGTKFSVSSFQIGEVEEKLKPEELIYKRSSRKILFMLKRFEDDRFTSFWL
jgi:AAA domain (dynein-related subfamily)